MKAAIIIAYILIAILAVVVFMEWQFIKTLTPASAGGNSGSSNSSGESPTNTGGRTASPASGDGLASFGSMIDAVKEGAKEMELKVTFNK